MVEKHNGGSSKRTRTENCVEEDVIRNQMRELKEENKQMKEDNKHMKEVDRENKELKDATAELRGMVECPVCLHVPKLGGPVPHPDPEPFVNCAR